MVAAQDVNDLRRLMAKPTEQEWETVRATIRSNAGRGGIWNDLLRFLEIHERAIRLHRGPKGRCWERRQWQRVRNALWRVEAQESDCRAQTAADTGTEEHDHGNA